MAVFDNSAFDSHECVTFFSDPDTGLKAIIAIHNTNLGAALGGCRMYPYATGEDALTDVLRLSKGMTYKAAMANLPLGGGKAVIIGDPKTQKSEALMEAMGRFVQQLNGRYIIAEDSGMNVSDLHVMAKQCEYLGGHKASFDYLGAPADGNPAPATAYGVFVGLRAAVRYRLNRTLRHTHVAIQGLGHVGHRLAKLLYQQGARLTITDIDPDLIEKTLAEVEAEVVSPDAIYQTDADVFAPCALGAVINDTVIDSLPMKIIAGAANNQLAEERHGRLLRERDIVYVPDYVLNAGGIIDIYHQQGPSSPQELRNHLDSIGDTVVEILTRADGAKLATNVVANAMAEERFLRCQQ